MNPRTLAYLKSQRPQLDVLGKWVYLPNARTGSTSITGALLDDRAIMWQRGWRNWERVWGQLIEPRADDVLFFTFVRNPWERVVSAWSFLRGKRRIGRSLTFPQYVNGGHLLDPAQEHFYKPQAPSFMMGGAMLDEVFVARHEAREEDWRVIAERIGAPTVLPHRNPAWHEHYVTYYDPESVRTVGRLYATEIEALEYEFGE